MRTFLFLLCSSFLVATVARAEDPPPDRLDETSPSALVDTTRTRAHGDLRPAWGREADGRRVMCAEVGPRDRACYRPGLRPRFVGSLEILAGLALAGGGTSMLVGARRRARARPWSRGDGRLRLGVLIGRP